MNKKGWIKKDRDVIAFAQEEQDILHKGCYKNLMLQVNKLARHSKGISITSQRQYYNHMDQFVRYLADEYGLKNLKNISGKHLAAYMIDRQNEGKSASTLKNDLAAIRYYHDQMEKTRHFLPTNKELEEKYNISMERRKFGGVNRRWSDDEYKNMVSLAYKYNRYDIANILLLGREQGLRIHEVIRLSSYDLIQSLKTGLLNIKGKGGLVRTVPLSDKTRRIFSHLNSQELLKDKVFVPKDKKSHEVIQSVQGFIQRHRDSIRKKNSNDYVPLTFHGLRHSYAYDRYEGFIQNGLSPEKARYEVSLLIGHSREDVTRIYLSI